MKFTIAGVLFAALLHAQVAQGQTTLTVRLDTTPLVNSTAGPFYLDFQLTDGSGTNDGNNVIVLDNFRQRGTQPSGLSSPTCLGGCTGNVLSSITLHDTTFLSELVQGFSPGGVLSFQVHLASHGDVGDTPDQFSFAILDRTLTELPTMSSVLLGVDVLVTADLRSDTSQLLTYSTDPNRPPVAGGSAIALTAPAAFATNFTDDPLTAGTVLKAVHIVELRSRIDSLRQGVGVPQFSWADPVLGSVIARAVHIAELRTALLAVYSSMARTAPSFTDSVLIPGVTAIKAAHIMELRLAVAAIE